ncbi:MAG: hypothetical protein KAR05_09770 [Candidatus Omnitrophica bacterium]|nr:hypothetical protein [Candidatus Omnitrophota bacterium]
MSFDGKYSDGISDSFHACKGNLHRLPREFKKWKTLQAYRKEWKCMYRYTTYTHISKLTEQCLMCDYLVSLDLWLEPFSIFKERSKIILVQLLASIYEAVLGHIINVKIAEEKNKSPLFNTTFYEEKFGDKRTFGPTLKISNKIGLLAPKWSEHLGKINKIRNWIHLGEKEIGPLKTFLERESCETLRGKLDEFRNYIDKLNP